MALLQFHFYCSPKISSSWTIIHNCSFPPFSRSPHHYFCSLLSEFTDLRSNISTSLQCFSYCRKFWCVFCCHCLTQCWISFLCMDLFLLYHLYSAGLLIYGLSFFKLYRAKKKRQTSTCYVIWEADRRTAGQEILCLAWNLKIHYSSHMNPTFYFVLSQMISKFN